MSQKVFDKFIAGSARIGPMLGTRNCHRKVDNNGGSSLGNVFIPEVGGYEITEG